MHPYAGITRIRFEGSVNAHSLSPRLRAPPTPVVSCNLYHTCVICIKAYISQTGTSEHLKPEDHTYSRSGDPRVQAYLVITASFFVPDVEGAVQGIDP